MDTAVRRRRPRKEANRPGPACINRLGRRVFARGASGSDEDGRDPIRRNAKRERAVQPALRRLPGPPRRRRRTKTWDAPHFARFMIANVAAAALSQLVPFSLFRKALVASRGGALTASSGARPTAARSSWDEDFLRKVPIRLFSWFSCPTMTVSSPEIDKETANL